MNLLPLRLRPAAAGGISGLLLALAFPSVGLFPLAWVALTPLLLFWLGRPSWRATLASHLAFCVIHFGLVLYWIPRVLDVYGNSGGAVAVGIFAVMLLTMSLYPLPFTLATRTLMDRDPRAALAAAPAGWLVSELLRNYFIVDGFPWAALGYSQHPYRALVQIVDLVGVYGLSWLVALGSVALAAWIGLRWKAPAVVLGGLLVLGNLYGLYRLYGWQPPSEAPLEAALVQPDIAVSGDREYFAKAFFQQLPRAYERAAAAGTDLVIFPEAPNPFLFLEDFYFNSYYRRLVDDFSVPLIFNGTARLERAVSLNSAFLLEPETESPDRYDKIHLVPFGEYLPYGEILGFSRPLVDHIGGFTAGDPRGELVRLGETPLGMLICYEAIFPELSRQASRQGAELLVNLTNDLWFGDTAAPEQHLQMAAFRAVEQRKFLLRAANSGYSGVIDPWGRIVRRTELFETRILQVAAAPNAYRTWYAFWGEAPSFLIIIMTALGIFAAGRLTSGRRSKSMQDGSG